MTVRASELKKVCAVVVRKASFLVVLSRYFKKLVSFDLAFFGQTYTIDENFKNYFFWFDLFLDFKIWCLFLVFFKAFLLWGYFTWLFEIIWNIGLFLLLVVFCLFFVRSHFCMFFRDMFFFSLLFFGCIFAECFLCFIFFGCSFFKEKITE